MLARVLLLLLTSIGFVAAAAAETHVVTATGNQWVYRDSRSGVGEAEAVQVYANPGDVVRFDQTSGTHGVIFYRSASEVSELGSSIDVDGEFKRVEGELLERLSTGRVFAKENLATPERTGTRHIITIKLKHNFQGPLYFADRVKSVRGQSLMFGVIRKALDTKAAKPLQLSADYSLDHAVRVMAAGRSSWNQDRSLGRLNPAIRRQVFKVPKPEEIRGLEPNERSEKWPVADWFVDVRLVTPLGISPFDAGLTWHFATVYDLDEDGDLDVVALVEKPDKSRRWWVLVNGVRTNSQAPATPRDLLGSLKKFSAAIPVSNVREDADVSKSFAVAGDLNGDLTPDLAFYDGADGRIHIAYQKFALDSPGYDFTEPKRLDTEISFELQDLVLIYPLDANSDGWTDLLVGSERASFVFFNRPSRGFSSTDAEPFPLPGSDIRRIGQEDLDGDQRFELIIENNEGDFNAYTNSGNGRFSIVEKEQQR